MNPSVNRDTDVLIVGAGPTGLVLALWLTRLGVRVRIVDKTAETGGCRNHFEQGSLASDLSSLHPRTHLLTVNSGRPTDSTSPMTNHR